MLLHFAKHGANRRGCIEGLSSLQICVCWLNVDLYLSPVDINPFIPKSYAF